MGGGLVFSFFGGGGLRVGVFKRREEGTGERGGGGWGGMKKGYRTDGSEQLTSKRRVGISEFKGKFMVNIREYYEKDGEVLPGKKVCLICIPFCFYVIWFLDYMGLNRFLDVMTWRSPNTDADLCLLSACDRVYPFPSNNTTPWSRSSLISRARWRRRTRVSRGLITAARGHRLLWRMTRRTRMRMRRWRGRGRRISRRRATRSNRVVFWRRLECETVEMACNTLLLQFGQIWWTSELSAEGLSYSVIAAVWCIDQSPMKLMSGSSDDGDDHM